MVQAADELCSRTWGIGAGAGAKISAGLATVALTGEHSHTPTSLLAAADQAQYVAKRNQLGYTMVSDQYQPLLDPTPS